MCEVQRASKTLRKLPPAVEGFQQKDTSLKCLLFFKAYPSPKYCFCCSTFVTKVFAGTFVTKVFAGTFVTKVFAGTFVPKVFVFAGTFVTKVFVAQPFSQRFLCCMPSLGLGLGT